MSLFDHNDRLENDYLIEKLDNFYNIEIYSEELNTIKPINLQKQMELIKEANLFVCILTKNYLNTPNCMSQLQYALKYGRKVFVLKNISLKIPNQIMEEYDLQKPNCKILNFIQEKNDQDRLLEIIYDHLK